MQSVLLVDDELPMLEAMSSVFTANGWEVVISRNGTDAAAVAEKSSFDLVLTDVVMEGLVGTALLEAIRTSHGSAQAPIVFMSSMPESRVRRLIEGVYGFVQKPFTFDQLMNAVAGAAPWH